VVQGLSPWLGCRGLVPDRGAGLAPHGLWAKLTLDTTRCDIAELSSKVSNREAFILLSPHFPNRDWSDVIHRNMTRMLCNIFDWESASRSCLEEMATRGARLSNLSEREIKFLRGDILRHGSHDSTRFILKWILDPQRCNPGISYEVTRTGAMKKRIQELHIAIKKPKRTMTVRAGRSRNG